MHAAKAFSVASADTYVDVSRLTHMYYVLSHARACRLASALADLMSLSIGTNGDRSMLLMFQIVSVLIAASPYVQNTPELLNLLQKHLTAHTSVPRSRSIICKLTLT